MPFVMTSLFGIVAAAGIVYGLLDLFAPQVTIRWQVHSTERANGLRRNVGEAFGSVIHRGATEPWNDPVARRRVRMIGVFLILIMPACLALLVSSSTG